jgi:aminodeoxyfutalosine deaminase
VALPADTVEALSELYEFTDFAHFIEMWLTTQRCLLKADDFRQLVVDYAAEAVSFGAVYLEAIFSPCERAQRGVDWDEMFNGYLDGAAEAHERHGIPIRFTPDLYRGVPVEYAEECARKAVQYADRGIVGLGLGGLESARPVREYQKAFEIARDGGLALVPHAGENAGPDSVWDVLTVRPDRIRHGVRAVEDPALLAEILDRGLVLDVCPTSNLRTRVVSTLDDHPLPALRAAGVPCSINTDDPAMFGTDLDNEYRIAERLGVSAADAFTAGLAGALCDDELRSRLAALAP